jgi:hypothetical protein
LVTARDGPQETAARTPRRAAGSRAGPAAPGTRADRPAAGSDRAGTAAARQGGTRAGRPGPGVVPATAVQAGPCAPSGCTAAGSAVPAASGGGAGVPARPCAPRHPSCGSPPWRGPRRPLKGDAVKAPGVYGSAALLPSCYGKSLTRGKDSSAAFSHSAARLVFQAAGIIIWELEFYFTGKSRRFSEQLFVILPRARTRLTRRGRTARGAAVTTDSFGMRISVFGLRPGPGEVLQLFSAISPCYWLSLALRLASRLSASSSTSAGWSAAHRPGDRQKADRPCQVSTSVEIWLWHSFRDAVRRVAHGADVASVIMCAVRS